MAEDSKNIYGKKVIFLTQNKFLINAIKSRLLTMEYEIYTINDHKIIKGLLLENPDSIIFLTPDFRLTPNGWKNFIRMLNRDFPEIKVGLFTKMNKNEIKAFTEKLKIEAGIIPLNDKDKDLDETFRQFVRILDSLDAKGLRQYVRANCITDTTCEAFWLEGDRMQKFAIVDISSVGVALQIPAKYYPALKDLQIIPNVKLVLKQKQVSINLNVYTIKQNKNEYTLVAMFPMEIKKDALTTIRNYISDRLHECMYKQIENQRSDETDYNNMIVKKDELLIE